MTDMSQYIESFMRWPLAFVLIFIVFAVVKSNNQIIKALIELIKFLKK